MNTIEKTKKTIDMIESLYQATNGDYTRQDIIEIIKITTLQDISERLDTLRSIAGGTHGIWGEMRDRY